MRMLIAEDDRMTADTLAKRLRSEYYAVDVCYDGENALHYLLSADYDVAVLDIMTEGADGLTVCKELRKRSNSLGIILLTAKTQELDKVNGLIQDKISALPF